MITQGLGTNKIVTKGFGPNLALGPIRKEIISFLLGIKQIFSTNKTL